MAGKTRIPVHQAVGKFISVEPDATKGAIVGVNLYWPDGSLVTVAQLTQASQSASEGPSQTDLYLEAELEEKPVITSLLLMGGGG